MSNNNTIDRAVDVVASHPFQILLAGLIGGVLRWLTTEKGWRGGLASIFSGLAAAWYLGPPTAALVSDVFAVSPDNPQLVAGVAFVVGIGGISIIALIVSVFRSLNTASMTRAVLGALADFLRFKFGGGPKP